MTKRTTRDNPYFKVSSDPARNDAIEETRIKLGFKSRAEWIHYLIDKESDEKGYGIPRQLFTYGGDRYSRKAEERPVKMVIGERSDDDDDNDNDE